MTADLNKRNKQFQRLLLGCFFSFHGVGCLRGCNKLSLFEAESRQFIFLVRNLDACQLICESLDLIFKTSKLSQSLEALSWVQDNQNFTSAKKAQPCRKLDDKEKKDSQKNVAKLDEQ